MNERILELATQVWPDPATSHVNHKKFAELIIEECAKVVEKNLYQNIGWNTARKVKEHFGIGVEE